MANTKNIKLKTLLPERIQTRINEEDVDPEVKKAFDELMGDLSSDFKSATSGIESKLKGKSEEELEKMATAASPELGKLAKESIQSRKKRIGEVSRRGRINELGPLFFASLALALPPIIEWIGKAAAAISKKFGGSGKIGEKIAHAGHFLHTMYKKALRATLNVTLFALPEMAMLTDSAKDKITDALFVVLIATFAYISGSGAIAAIKGLHIGTASAEAALAAIKSQEVVAFVTNTIKSVLA